MYTAVETFKICHNLRKLTYNSCIIGGQLSILQLGEQNESRDPFLDSPLSGFLLLCYFLYQPSTFAQTSYSLFQRIIIHLWLSSYFALTELCIELDPSTIFTTDVSHSIFDQSKFQEDDEVSVSSTALWDLFQPPSINYGMREALGKSKP